MGRGQMDAHKRPVRALAGKPIIPRLDCLAKSRAKHTPPAICTRAHLVVYLRVLGE